MQGAAILAGVVVLGGIAYALTRKTDTQQPGQNQSVDVGSDYEMPTFRPWAQNDYHMPDLTGWLTPEETVDTGAITIMDVLTNPVETIGAAVDRIAGTNISKMSQVTPELLDNANIKAMLRVIRRGEGTSDQAGYRRIFGGQMFTSYADHPRIKITAGGYTSTAAGAYQFLQSTWDETAKILGLQDFSPASQDLAAVARFVYRKALDDVLRGDLDAAMPKLGKEWASMPGSPYGQPVITMQTAQATFQKFGGVYA